MTFPEGILGAEPTAVSVLLTADELFFLIASLGDRAWTLREWAYNNPEDKSLNWEAEQLLLLRERLGSVYDQLTGE